METHLATTATGDNPTDATTAGAGWHELVAELRADRDRLRSELAAVSASRDVARQRAELAETGNVPPSGGWTRYGPRWASGGGSCRG